MPRREWRAKKLGVPVDQLPDNRGRKESLQDCIERNSMPITESGCVVQKDMVPYQSKEN